MPPERTEPKVTLALWNLLFLKKPPAVCLTSGLDRMGLKSSWNDKVENVEAAPLPLQFFRFEMADNQFNRLHRERVGARDCGTWSCSFPMSTELWNSHYSLHVNWNSPIANFRLAENIGRKEFLVHAESAQWPQKVILLIPLVKSNRFSPNLISVIATCRERHGTKRSLMTLRADNCFAAGTCTNNKQANWTESSNSFCGKCSASAQQKIQCKRVPDTKRHSRIQSCHFLRAIRPHSFDNIFAEFRWAVICHCLAFVDST